MSTNHVQNRTPQPCLLHALPRASAPLRAAHVQEAIPVHLSHFLTGHLLCSPLWSDLAEEVHSRWEPGWELGRLHMLFKLRSVELQETGLKVHVER